MGRDSPRWSMAVRTSTRNPLQAKSPSVGLSERPWALRSSPQQWNRWPRLRANGTNTSAQKPVAWTSRRSAPRPPKSYTARSRPSGVVHRSRRGGRWFSPGVTPAKVAHLDEAGAPHRCNTGRPPPCRHWWPMEHFLETWGYLAVFVLSFISSMGLPVGAEVAIIYGGVLASGQIAHDPHHLNVIGVIAVAAIAEVLGSLVGYLIGYFGGRPLVDRAGRYV